MEHQKGAEANSLREALIRKQAELDETLRTLSEEVELWNLRLEYCAETCGDDESELSSLAFEAVRSLDEKWPFYGDYIHVSGRWSVTDFEMTQDSITYGMVKQDAFNVVQSNGFSILRDEREPPKVGLSFSYGEQHVLNAAVQGRLTLLTHANPSEVSLHYIRPEEKGTLKADTSELRDNLIYYDRLLNLYYHNDNSDFYKTSIHKQRKFLTEITDTMSDSLPSPEHGYYAMCEEIEVPYVFRRIADGTGGKWQQMYDANSETMLLSGRVEGLGILESSELLQQKPLRSKSDLVDPNAGICLILQIEESTIPDRFNNQPVYVPLRLSRGIKIRLP